MSATALMAHCPSQPNALAVTPLANNYYLRSGKTLIATLGIGAGYSAGTPASAQITFAGSFSNPTKAPNTDALGLASSWLGDLPLATEIPVWDAHLLAANSSAITANTTWAGMQIGSGTAAPAGNVTVTGAFSLTLNGILDLGDTRNLTAAVNSLVFQGLTGTTTLTISNTSGVFNGSVLANGLNFNGSLALRGGSNSIQGADGVAGSSGNFYLLNGTTQSQAADSKFALDTGTSLTDRKDFGWIMDNGNVLTLSSLRGYGAIRNDAGGTASTTVTRYITVDQSAGDTTFDGALLSHTSSGTAVRRLVLTKNGNSKLTLAGFIGKQTTSAGAAASPVDLIVNNGTLEITNPTNSTTTNTAARNTAGVVTLNGGTFAFANNAWANTSAGGFVMNGGTLKWTTGNTQDVSARLAPVASGQTAVFDTNGNPVTFASALSGEGAITKIGDGVLTLEATNPLSAITTVQAGTLRLNGNLTGLGGAHVLPSATLAGSGSVTGPVTLSGSLQPGDGLGTLTAGPLTLAPGSSITWQIADWTGTPGTGSDRILAAAACFTATALAPLTIVIDPQSLTHFTDAPATFTLLESTTAITGFSPEKCAVIQTAFTSGTGGTGGTGVWNVQLSADALRLELVYSGPTPDSNNNGIDDTWEIAKFGSAGPGEHPASADPDGDGISNLLEYAFDTSPTNPSVNPLSLDIETIAMADHLRLTVSKNPAASRLSYIVEVSSNLSASQWGTADTFIEQNTPTRLVVRDTTTGLPRRFLRLRVEVP
jgi:autotransporter-associated beta strand protein